MKKMEEDKLIAKVILFSVITSLAVSVWISVLGLDVVIFIVCSLTLWRFIYGKNK